MTVLDSPRPLFFDELDSEHLRRQFVRLPLSRVRRGDEVSLVFGDGARGLFRVENVAARTRTGFRMVRVEGLDGRLRLRNDAEVLVFDRLFDRR